VAGSPVAGRAKTTQQGYVLREKGKLDSTPARAEKRTASRFYQLKSGYTLTGVYLKSTDNRPDDQCWWCDPENDFSIHQTRDHLFKHCCKWKDQQAAMWAMVREETKGKQKRRVGDQLADDRCSPAVLRSTHVGRAAHPGGGETGTEGSEGDPVEAGKDGAQEAETDGVEEQAELVTRRLLASGFLGTYGIGFLPFAISLVRLWCVIYFGNGGARDRGGRQSGLGYIG